MTAVAATWTIDEIERPLRSILQPQAATEPQPDNFKKRKRENASWPDLEWRKLLSDILNTLYAFPEAYAAVRDLFDRQAPKPEPA